MAAPNLSGRLPLTGVHQKPPASLCFSSQDYHRNKGCLYDILKRRIKEVYHNWFFLYKNYTFQSIQAQLVHVRAWEPANCLVAPASAPTPDFFKRLRLLVFFSRGSSSLSLSDKRVESSFVDPDPLHETMKWIWYGSG